MHLASIAILNLLIARSIPV